MQFYSKMEHRPTEGAIVAVNHTANQIICQIIVLKKIPQKAQTQQTLHEVAEMTPSRRLRAHLTCLSMQPRL